MVVSEGNKNFLKFLTSIHSVIALLSGSIIALTSSL